MVSAWMVAVRKEGGKKLYNVYRLKDRIRPDHGDNREYRGYWCKSQRAAREWAAYLNEQDRRKGETAP